MIIARDTPKNRLIINKIADLEMDLQMFHRDWSDEVISEKLDEIQKLHREIE